LPRIEYVALSDVRDDRRVGLFTSGPAWDALGGSLDLSVISRTQPTDATQQSFIAAADQIPAETQAIYAVGGGLAFDSAKFAAHHRSLPLIGVPTAISTDAPLTPFSGIRRDGGVSYIATGAPNVLYVDWDVISAAPSHIRGTGFAEMVSIITGLWDWRFAEERAQNPPDQRLVEYAAALMAAMADECLKLATSIGRGDVEALRQLLDMLALQVQVCSCLGHSRPQEGSEHYFAYSVENLTGPGLPHVDLLGPGILAMAAAQGQDPAPLREAMLAVGARLDRISADHVRETLAGLPTYSSRHDLPYGVAHALTPAQAAAALQAVT
jgi:glycerol dehydrogenase-like iron-containing ADH family enzyme